MAMTSMNISLPEELKEYVEQQAQGGYSTPSEFVRELIRHDQKCRAQQRLEALLLEGLDSGESMPTDERFWADLRREAFQMIARHRKSKVVKRK